MEAGAQWQDVVAAAAPYGLAALHGSAPDVGVVGYTLGGGLGWYARKHGFACHHVVGIEVVDAHGEVVRADAESHAELFWALRGGGGRLGVVSTIEVELLPIADVHAGMMIWDVARAREVLHAYAAWSRTAPEEVTASFRVLRLPPLPELPPFLSGRTVVVLDAAVLLDDEAAGAVLAPFRDLAPEVDTFGRVPAAALTELHMDPPQPSPGVGDGTALSHLDDDAVEAFLGIAGAGVESPLMVAELRLLGGALARVPADAGALRSVDGSHGVFFMCMAPTPEVAALAEQAVDAAVTALRPWTAERGLLNFRERAVDLGDVLDPATVARLRTVAREVDPDGLFVAQHTLGD